MPNTQYSIFIYPIFKTVKSDGENGKLSASTFKCFISQIIYRYLYKVREMPEELYTEKEYGSVLMKTLGDSPKLRIIDFFLDNPLLDFTKKEVIEALGMSKRTFYKYFPDLEENGIVVVSRRIGRAKLYRINLKHPLVEMLREYEKKISLQITEKEGVKGAPSENVKRQVPR